MSEVLARQWLSAVLDVSIQFTVLVAIVATALFLLRSLPPRVRTVVWLVVLLRLAIPAGLTSPWGALPASFARPPSATLPAVADGTTVNRLPASEGSEASGSSAVAAGPTIPSGSAIPTTPSGAAMSFGAVLFMLWGVGVLGLLTLHAFRSARRRRRLAAAMKPLPAEIDRRIDQLRSELGMLRPVEVRVVRDDAISGPAIQGCLRPCILLPLSLTESWRREELDPVLLHELIHIQRLDPAVRALANLLQIAWFFHPLAWWVGRRLGEEREKACDDAVVRRLRGEKQTYVRGLLRLVEERSAPAWDAPGLRMATSRRLLARRLSRMLQSHYDPHSTVGTLALTALVVSVGAGVVLSTEAGMRPGGEAQEPPRIQGRTAWRGAFFAESVEQIEDADRVYVGGDFTIGRASTPLKPDAEALAARNPALFERLEALGRLSATIIVDREGTVRRVRFTDDVDEDLRRPFLEVLDAARFDPTTHFERGPVLVELQIDYFINPPEPRESLYDRDQALVGDEAAEMMGGGRGGRRRYAAVLAKGELPVLDVVDGELILSFLLSVDAGGKVESSELFRDSRAPRNPEPESTPEAERLMEYLRTFRFEPVAAGGGTPDRPKLVLDLRVSPRGVEVATRAVDEEELDRRLAETYRLAEGRNLDLRPPTHPPERMLLYRTGRPIQARAVPDGPSQMTIVWTDDGPRFRGACFGCEDLLSVLDRLGVRRDAVRFEAGADNVRIEADLVIRQGAPDGALLDELPRALKERFDLDLGFRRVSEVSRALVLRGVIGAVPPDDERDGQRVLHVFTDRRDPRTGAGGGPFPDVGDLVELLSFHLGMPVIDRTTGTPEQPFYVRLHPSAQRTQRLDLLIRNLESQTDLDIEIAERPDRFVVVSPS